MLLFNIGQSFSHFSNIKNCPQCGSNSYHLVNNSRFLRFTLLPILPLKLNYHRECYQCGYTAATAIKKLPLVEQLSLPKYCLGLVLILGLSSYIYQQQLHDQVTKLTYLSTPKAYDTYLVHADKFTGEPWTPSNLKVAQVVEFDQQLITFQVSNYSYKRNNGITMAMRTSLLVQKDYFSANTLTLPRNQVAQLYRTGAIYDILRPKAYTLYGGFVMFPPKPKPLYKGLKLDDNNQQGINYYKQGLYAEALRRFTLAAEANSPWGQLNLAQMYRDGEGVEQNNQHAIYWFKKASEQHNRKAADELSRLCAQVSCE